MYIFPRVVSDNICYACGRNKADSSVKMPEVKMYRSIEKHGNRVIYNGATVACPMCKECSKTRWSAFIMPVLLLILGLLCVLTMWLYGVTTHYVTYFFWWTMATTAVSGMFSMWGMCYIFGRTRWRNYPPVDLLRKYGWEYGVSPSSAANIKPRLSEMEVTKLYTILVEDHHCVVKS